jgi:hypothetical protein
VAKAERTPAYNDAVSVPRLCAYACAAILVSSVSYGLLRMPLQVHDSLEEIIAAQQSPGVWASFTSTIGETTYFRPLRIAETKLLLDLSGGHYFAAYKVFHIALLAAAFALFVGALRIETGVDLAAALFALTIFTGLHTFLGLVKEGYPVNHFLQVVVLVLAAVRLSKARGGRWIDAAAIAAFIAACLTLESGVLVWVALAASRLSGRRGVSDSALVAMTGLLVAYGLVRFVWLAPHVQAMANASGYGFERLEGSQIRERFGAGLSRFNVYNVLASMATVLFSEPRSGVFVFFRGWSLGDVPPRIWINVVSSTITTAFIVLAILSRGPRRAAPQETRSAMTGPTMRRGPSRSAETADFIVFGAVLAASAVASYAYAKDEIMSVAGIFYALAAFWAVRDLMTRGLRAAPAVAVALALLVAGSGWAVRTIGVNHVLRAQAFAFHNDWAWIPEDMERRGTWPSDPSMRKVIIELRDRSIAMPIVNPWFVPRWADRVFDVDYF